MNVTICDLSTMELTIEDYEEEYDGMWRIFNGRYFTHACNTKEQAISRAKIWGGTHVGLAFFNKEKGMNDYIDLVKV